MCLTTPSPPYVRAPDHFHYVVSHQATLVLTGPCVLIRDALGKPQPATKASCANRNTKSHQIQKFISHLKQHRQVCANFPVTVKGQE